MSFFTGPIELSTFALSIGTGGGGFVAPFSGGPEVPLPRFPSRFEPQHRTILFLSSAHVAREYSSLSTGDVVLTEPVPNATSPTTPASRTVALQPVTGSFACITNPLLS